MQLEFSPQYFMWLTSMTTSLFFYAWPITLTLVALTGFCWFNWAKATAKPKLNWGWLLGVCSIALIILLYGTLHRAGKNWKPRPYSELASYIVSGFLITQLCLSGMVIHRSNRGARLVSISVLVWGLYLSLSASFITLMSVSGQWL